MNLGTLQVARLIILAFFAVLFLQSGLDKVTDRKGNLAWLTGHFSKTPFKNGVPALLSMMTLLELASGLLCLAGLVSLLVKGPDWIGLRGVQLAGFSFLCLFTGQRLAKDYAGAATLAIYMGVDLIAMGLFA